MAVLYRLLGGLERNVDPLSSTLGSALPAQRVRGLLALLLVTPCRVWSRQALTAELYPSERDSARARLSDHLYSVRTSCPELVLQVSRDTVCWTGEGADTDLRSFLAVTGSPESSELEPLAAALDLYRGDLLPELDLEFIDNLREHVRGRYAAGLLSLGKRLEGVSRWVEAQQLYERWLVRRPEDEVILLRYLNLCFELGQRTRGLEAYGVAERLWADLRVPPSRELLEAAARLSGLRARVVERPPSRTDALSKIDEAWWLMASSRAQTLLDEGPGAVSPDVWSLRRWMLADIRGEWSALGVGIQALLADAAQKGAARDPGWEALALQLLGRAQAEGDSLQEAARSFDKAAALLRRVAEGHPTAALSAFAPAEALLSWGELNQIQLQLQGGRSDAALEACRRLCGRLDDREAGGEPWVAVLSLRARSSLGALLLQSGRSWEAVSWLDQARARGERLGALELLDALVPTVAAALDNLGRWDESGPLLDEAARRAEAQGVPFRWGKVLYILAAHHGSRPDGDLSLGLTFAQQAIVAFQSVASLGWEASTHTTKGFLSWQQGRFAEALEEYARARELHTSLQEEFFLTEIGAYEALCHLDLGDVDRAVALSRQAVETSLAVGETSVACDLWFIYSECLRTAGQDADGPLRRAAEQLFGEAAALPHPEACKALLQRDPIVRRLVDRLREQNLLADYQRRLPPAVFGGGDASPATALRRVKVAEAFERLRRRGDRPSAALLARLVGAGVRTIERDLAWLKTHQTGGGFRA